MSALGAIDLVSSANADVPANNPSRVQQSYLIRRKAALRDRQITIPPLDTNRDEERYSNFIGSFSKGLPHDRVGEVDRAAYDLLRAAVLEGTPSSFEQVPLGGTAKLANPISGLAFDLEGLDSHQCAILPAPAVDSDLRAAEMVELYWQALCRDINFSEYIVTFSVCQTLPTIASKVLRSNLAYRRT